MGGNFKEEFNVLGSINHIVFVVIVEIGQTVLEILDRGEDEGRGWL